MLQVQCRSISMCISTHGRQPLRITSFFIENMLHTWTSGSALSISMKVSMYLTFGLLFHMSSPFIPSVRNFALMHNSFNNGSSLFYLPLIIAKIASKTKPSNHVYTNSAYTSVTKINFSPPVNEAYNWNV